MEENDPITREEFERIVRRISIMEEFLFDEKPDRPSLVSMMAKIDTLLSAGVILKDAARRMTIFFTSIAALISTVIAAMNAAGLW